MECPGLNDLICQDKADITLPEDYQKKIVNSDGDCPLSETFTTEQIRRKIAFYQELNQRREEIPQEPRLIEKKFAIYGWDGTTTVRVYLRETILKIAAELFSSDYSLSLKNVNPIKENGEIDKDHGYVVMSIRATIPEIRALLEYIEPCSSYYVYDGEKSEYVAGNTAESGFIITKIRDAQQPKKFWRRSQSFVASIKELD